VQRCLFVAFAFSTRASVHSENIHHNVSSTWIQIDIPVQICTQTGIHSYMNTHKHISHVNFLALALHSLSRTHTRTSTRTRTRKRTRTRTRTHPELNILRADLNHAHLHTHMQINVETCDHHAIPSHLHRIAETATHCRCIFETHMIDLPGRSRHPCAGAADVCVEHHGAATRQH